ncbi:hypothetical protein BDD12DRAFT_871905 [Trichophaea hybrida]|nr:hypothetical protein BDD12DRAFT_871905 [Trichophaea hybrida]
MSQVFDTDKAVKAVLKFLRDTEVGKVTGMREGVEAEGRPQSKPQQPQHILGIKVLEKEFGGGDTGKYSAAGSHGGTKNSKNVEGGLKATMKNPNTSEEAKMHAKERLESGDL